jgi:AAA+ ATPase superfamily predicted ATPase
MDKIINRVEEKKILLDFLRSKEAEFLAIYGRRRIGKSFLIKTLFSRENCIFFHATGIKSGKLHEQIKEFTKQIGHTFYGGIELKYKTNWLDTFELLNNALERLDKRKKAVLFLDELPWMVSKRSRLLQALEYYWNHYWNWDTRVKLIVCGSSASWILKKIIHNTGGLYNRVTKRIKLEPFNLNQSREMLKAKGIRLNNGQILEIYMVTGGVPLYLNYIQKGLSAQQNINELCFNKKGFLREEFPTLIKSLFNESDTYLELLRNIAKHCYGIDKNELAKKSKMSLGGRLTSRLSDLEEAGFITSFIPYGHKDRGIYYKVIDEYTLFYFYWIESNIRGVAKNFKGKLWQTIANSPAYKSWAGYAFEAICYKHITQIIKALGIDSIRAIGSWRYAPYKKETSGAQIDLLFDRGDEAITICEIKYTNKPFIIDKEYASKLMNKVKIFKEKTGTKKQIFLAMISANGIKPTMYSEELISSVATLDDLFRE